MAQITVTFESYEDLKEFAEKLLGTKQETNRKQQFSVRRQKIRLRKR